MMREKLHKILDLVLDLNEKNDAFMYLYGHVNSITVDISDGEWKYDEKKLYYKDVYYAGQHYTEKDLDKVITKLEELKGETK